MTRTCLHRAAIAGLAALAIAAAVATPGFAQGDALLGAWTFVSERSKFTPGPVPYKDLTLKFSATERGLRNDAEGVDADGRPISATYVIVPDGKYHPITGVPEFDSSSYTRVGDKNTVYVRQKHGTTVVVGSRALTGGGKTLIFRQKSVDNLGMETGRALLVFEKQEEPG